MKKTRGSRINSILLNPTIDQIYEIENFKVGGTFKVNKSSLFPVGKAISFALGIRELTSSEAILRVLAVIGKDDITLYSDFLSSRNIDFKFLEVEGKTRSNKTINDPIQKTTTHIRERGFELKVNDVKNIYKILKDNIEEGDFTVISGSIPPGVTHKIYYDIINICKNEGALIVLDTNGPALVNGVLANPNIIKPNLVELSQILNDPQLNNLDFSDIIETSREIAKKAKVLLNNELEVVLITLGDKGAICMTNEKIVYGNVQVDKIIDTVGSGDSFLAGFIFSYYQEKALTECFKLAIACGAANTLIPGPGIFQIDDVKKIIKKVKIFNLD